MPAPRALVLAILTACAGEGAVLRAGSHDLRLSPNGKLDIADSVGGVLTDVRMVAGVGSADITMQVGSFRFDDVQADLRVSNRAQLLSGGDYGPAAFALFDGADLLGTLTVLPNGDALDLRFQAAEGVNRLGVVAACEADDHFLGAGQHALDVDHVGEAFGLWVSEPGIGKNDTDAYPADWFTQGTRHSSSWPLPWVLRPQLSHGLLLDADGRVDLDLCASDTSAFSMVAWDQSAVTARFVAAQTPVGVLSELWASLGENPALPPPWVFTPWGDAIRGPEAVDGRAATHRGAGASVSALWTEDWRGAFTSAIFGYHPAADWDLGEELYTDAADQADRLEAQGFQWLAYFAPFVTEGTETWTSAVAADALIHDEAGEIYRFTGFFLEPVSVVDLSPGSPGRDWARAYMTDCLDLGFDGWMADFAEWLPHDAVLADGSSGALAHNRYPEWWQEVHAEAIAGSDATFFARSGWVRSAKLAPVVWAGDQRTDFQPDDGFPTVVALGLGAGASGVPVWTHDVAGYQSATNPPADAELWYRWAALGAFSPILRTHHGNESLLNHQFDSDAETTARWAELTHQHMALFPYRYGLARQAVETGVPMVLPPVLLFPEDDPARMDGWMLGSALFVAPVLEKGATGRDVALPPGRRWLDWWTLQPAESGFVDVPWDFIPVYLAEGSIVPTLVEIPDTAVEEADAALTTLSEVDDQRRVFIFGAGGSFVEADGTRYTLQGTPSAPAELAFTGASGVVNLGGARLVIEGTVERAYSLVLVP